MLIHNLEAALLAIGRNTCLEAVDGAAVSGHALAADVGRGASALLSVGIVQGDRILVTTSKSRAAATLALSALRTGAVLTPLPADILQQQLEAVIDDAQPAIVAAPAKLLSRLATKLRMSRVRTVFSLEDDGSGTWTDLTASQQPARMSVLVRPADLALLSYDVGHLDRAAMVTHAALARQADLARQMLDLAKGGTLVLTLKDWGLPPGLAMLLAAWLSQARVSWREMSNDTVADALVAEAAMPVAPSVARVFARYDGPAPAGAHRYLALPEAGIIALRRPGEELALLEGFDAEIENGRLVLADKAIFAGYWRRTPESERALKAGHFATGLEARLAEGRIVLAPQP